MSRYGDLETNVAARLLSSVPTLGASLAVPVRGAVELTTWPTATTTWVSTQKEQVIAINQILRIIARVKFTVLLYVGSSGLNPGDARGDAYTLGDACRAALNGYQPAISGVENVFPIVVESEDPFEVETGEYGLALECSMLIQFTQGVA